MLQSAIPFKTAAGRVEIDERKQKIGARHRMVLISINGERSVDDIRKQFAAISEIDTLLDELNASGLIEVAEEVTVAEAVAAPVKAAAAAPTKPAAKPVIAAKPVASASEKDALRAAREFMNRILTAKVGIRAFLFNQKIDRSDSKQALLDLLPEFRRILRKSVDAGRVAEFSAHAEHLIEQS